MTGAGTPTPGGPAPATPAPPRRSLAARALRDPGYAIHVALSILKGHWYKWSYPLRGIRFEAGRNLRVEGSLHIRGPGRVVFGDDVIVGDRTTPWTHDPDAVISVGSGTFLNGTRFGCARSISVGERCLLAESQIMDTDFHSILPNRHSPEAPIRVAPVVLEDNVWIAARTGVLPGTRVGRNSVVGYGSVCTGVYPADSLIAGNPARVIRPLPGTEGPA